jgi:hypothetical protein
MEGVICDALPAIPPLASSYHMKVIFVSSPGVQREAPRRYSPRCREGESSEVGPAYMTMTSWMPVRSIIY